MRANFINNRVKRIVASVLAVLIILSMLAGTIVMALLY
jgi:hypothetical protein